MCIIVAKDKLTPLPQEKYLKNCFDNNPDGAGFMYVHNNKVIIDKGYMTYDLFLKRYHKLCKKYHNFKNKSLVMHFRIGTAGANSKENTHPYVITYNKDILHKTKYKTDLGVAHNGIIHDYNPHIDDKTTNDTQNFIMKYIYPLYKHYPKFYKNKYIMEGIKEITNSKFAFLDKCDNIYLVGDFEKDDSGVKYSNSNYLPYYNYGYDYYKYYDRYLDRYNYDYTPKTTTATETKDDEEFVYDKLDSQYRYDYEVELDSEWYYSIKGKTFEKVGDRTMIYDCYYGLLYEVDELGEYRFIDENVIVYDENGEEIIF